MFQFEEPDHFQCKSSDEYLNLLGQASMGIKNDLQKKGYSMKEKNQNTWVKCLIFYMT